MVVYKKEMMVDFFSNCLEVEKKLHSDIYSLNLPRKNRRGHLVSTEFIYTNAINYPAKSFYYADAEQILIAINRFKKCNSDKKKSAIVLRKQHIYNLYTDLEKKFPNLKPIEIAEIINDMSAPRFYISVSYAKTIFYSMLKHYRRTNCKRKINAI